MHGRGFTAGYETQRGNASGRSGGGVFFPNVGSGFLFFPNVGSTRGGSGGGFFLFIGVAHLFLGGHTHPCDC